VSYIPTGAAATRKPRMKATRVVRKSRMVKVAAKGVKAAPGTETGAAYGTRKPSPDAEKPPERRSGQRKPAPRKPVPGKKATRSKSERAWKGKPADKHASKSGRWQRHGRPEREEVSEPHEPAQAQEAAPPPPAPIAKSSPSGGGGGFWSPARRVRDLEPGVEFDEEVVQQPVAKPKKQFPTKAVVIGVAALLGAYTLWRMR